jgi:hypothetical protein
MSRRTILPSLISSLTCLASSAALAQPAGDAGQCLAHTCQQINAMCGLVGDGCGNVLNCGTCTPPQVCTPNLQCLGTPDGGCAPTTCQLARVMCGEIGDGCGQVLQCGPCPPGAMCIMGQCSAPPPDAGPPLFDSGTCVPRTCQSSGASCGQVPNGCGMPIECGTCAAQEMCISNQCAAPSVDAGPTDATIAADAQQASIDASLNNGSSSGCSCRDIDRGASSSATACLAIGWLLLRRNALARLRRGRER